MAHSLHWFLPPGGAREAEIFIAALAAKIAKKNNLEYSSIMHWLRVKLSFNLVKSAVYVVFKGI